MRRDVRTSARIVALSLLLAFGVPLAQAKDMRGVRVPLKVYIMSKCPFAKQVILSLQKVTDRMGRSVDLGLDYIGTDTEGQLATMHGDSELQGDKVFLCLQTYWPDNYNYLKVMACMANDMVHIPDNFDQCADSEKMPRSSADKVRKCAAGDEGTRLVRESFERSSKAGARGSPTIKLNEASYSGGRSEMAFMRALCSAFPSASAPAECATLPPVTPVDIIVIGDQRCTDPACDTARIEKSITSTVLGTRIVQRLDWSDEEAKRLMRAEGVTYLPALLFAPSVDSADGSDSLKRYLRATTSGKYRLLDLGTKHDPTAEICDNSIDDTQNGLVDCEEPSCQKQITCRPETTGVLELFIMSQCPFAAKAVTALQELLPAFGPELKLVVHYIGTNNDGVPSSLHGPDEVTADILCMCASSTISDTMRFVDWMACMNQDQRRFTQNLGKCTNDKYLSGDILAAIRSCADSPSANKRLLQDFTVAQDIGITASPTWVINGRHKFNGIVPQVIQTNICKFNPGMSGCKASLRAK